MRHNQGIRRERAPVPFHHVVSSKLRADGYHYSNDILTYKRNATGGIPYQGDG